MAKKMTPAEIEERIQKTNHLKPNIRLDAIKYLWQTRDVKVLPILVELLKDEAQDVRIAALESLKNCHKKGKMENVDWFSVETKVIELTDDKAVKARAYSLDCLAELGRARSVLLLSNKLDEDEKVQSFIYDKEMDDVWQFYDYGNLFKNLTEEDLQNLIESEGLKLNDKGRVLQSVLKSNKEIRPAFLIGQAGDLLNKCQGIPSESLYIINTVLKDARNREVINILMPCLDSTHHEVKLAAAIKLGLAGDYSAEKYVLSELKNIVQAEEGGMYEYFNHYRYHAPEFFRHSGNRDEAATIISELLEEDKKEVREESIGFMVRSGVGNECLLKIFSSGSSEDKSCILKSIYFSSLGKVDYFDFSFFKDELKKIAADSFLDTEDRIYALKSLAQVLGAADFFHLINSLDDRERLMGYYNYFWSGCLEKLRPVSEVNNFLLELIENQECEFREKALTSLVLRGKSEIQDRLLSIVNDKKDDKEIRNAALDSLKNYLLKNKIDDEQMNKLFFSLLKQRPFFQTCLDYLIKKRHPEADELLRQTFNKNPKWFEGEFLINSIMYLGKIGDMETITTFRKVRQAAKRASYSEGNEIINDAIEKIKHRFLNN